MLKVLLSLILSCVLSVAYADSDLKPLPAAQAFSLSGHVSNAHLVLHWDVAPGYYIYRDSVKVLPAADNEVNLGAPALPAGVMKNDILHGNFQAYMNAFEVRIPLKAATGRLAITLTYQGCSSAGFCYTPIKKSLIVNAAALNSGEELIATDASAPIHSFSDQSYITQLLNGHHYFLMMLSFLFIGLLLAFTPCVLPMVPILSSIIVGHGRHLNSKKAFFLSLAYVLGMALAYAAAGMLIALLGSNIQLYMEKPWVIGIFSGLFIVLALSLFGLFELRLPNALQQRLASRSHKQQGGTYAGVFLMGVFSTLIVSPCVSAPLVGVLAYIAKSGDVILGGVALLALGLGMGLPLLLLGTSAGKLLPKAGAWMEAVKHFFGLMMLAVAIWLLARILPGPAVLFLWALLAIVTAVYVRQFQRSKRLWKHLHEGLGIALLCYGFILMAGAIIGKNDPFYILEKSQLTFAASKPVFSVVKNMEQLDQELLQAKNNNQEVILDFYADWCVSCVIMDRSVFTQPEIKKALEKFVLLRADVTQNNDFDQAILHRFQIVAPPTMVFFDAQGTTLTTRQIVGEVDSKQFLADIDRLRYDKKMKDCNPALSTC